MGKHGYMYAQFLDSPVETVNPKHRADSTAAERIEAERAARFHSSNQWGV